MKLITSISISAMMLSCNVPKTVHISNKTGSPITLMVDSSYQNTRENIFKDSIDGDLPPENWTLKNWRKSGDFDNLTIRKIAYEKDEIQ